MNQRKPRHLWTVLLLLIAIAQATTTLTQNSFAATTDNNQGRPAEANLYEHLKNAFVNPQNDPHLPKVLIIGDSISIGYTVPVRKYLEGKANVYRPPVNCQHTAYGLENVKNWIDKEKWDVIHFNWGIWDTHFLEKETGKLVLCDKASDWPKEVRLRHSPEEYRENLNKLVKILKTTDAKLIWASSTPLMSRTGERFKDIERFNQVAASVMKENGVEIDDLYHFVLPNTPKWQLPDQCHFNAIGNENLSKKVGDAILKALDSPAMPTVTEGKESVINGHKVIRFEHDSGKEWGYEKPQKDYFYVIYPKTQVEGKVPLRIYLHSAGGSGESELAFNDWKMQDTESFYGLSLDCRGNQANDWWWGYDTIKKTPEQFKDKLYPTEQRVLATIAWMVSKFNIDPNRIYLHGISMGGSGSLGIGLRRGDVFAAISVTVPAGADHALFRMDGTQYPDPPPVFDFSSQNDQWSSNQADLINFCQKNRYFLAFSWGPLGHINDRTKFNPMVYEFPWFLIRKNEAYPAFTNASSDNIYPGFQNLTAADQSGQINGCFRWKNLVDTADQFAMELRLVRKEELKHPVETPTEAEADVTLRRLQNFRVEPKKTYHWQMTQNDKAVQSGEAKADEQGVLTISDIKISTTPASLEITGSR